MRKILFTITQGYSLDADDLTDKEIKTIIEAIHDNDYDKSFTPSNGRTFHIVDNAEVVYFDSSAFDEV